jgi:heptosyltransferase-2
VNRAAAPARLVIRAPNWLGDAVMALPALDAVRRALPESFIAVAATPSVAPIFEEDTIARPDAVVALDKRREAAALRAGTFDAILLLPNSFRSAWVGRQAAIPERWGYSANLRSALLTKRVSRPRTVVHQCVYYFDLIRALGFDGEPRPPSVSVKPETVARAVALLERNGLAMPAELVGFAPGAAYGHAKRWPPSRVAETIVRLSRERGTACVLVGAGADRDAAREIESSLPSDVRAINLIGRTSLRELAGVLSRCSAFVSNDSGAMHLAAAIGVPVAAIFGPTNERVTAPVGAHDVLVHEVFCRPCMLRDCPIDHRCMKGISAASVFDVVSRRLDARV